MPLYNLVATQSGVRAVPVDTHDADESAGYGYSHSRQQPSSATLFDPDADINEKAQQSFGDPDKKYLAYPSEDVLVSARSTDALVPDGSRAYHGQVPSASSLDLGAPDETSDLARFLHAAWIGDPRVPRVPEIHVAWKDLSVEGVGAGSKFGDTCLSALYTPFSPSNIRAKLHPPIKTILKPTTGALRAGEMLLVLGRPGSGCTTFLKTLASYREGYHAVNGNITYGGFDHTAIEGPLRGEAVYSAEEDVLFPSLNVKDTLSFATEGRMPQKNVRPSFHDVDAKSSTYIDEVRDCLARTLGLSHTYKTPVGDAQIRGVSGGEKKRVSLVEAMTTHARLLLLDNPSRGLDASTTTELATSLQTMCRVTQASCAASMYQAGEPVYARFDKVILLNDGHVIYYGPASKAVQYFHDMGYEQFEHQTSADFLVAVTDASARKIRPGYEQTVPVTAEQMASYWAISPLGLETAAEANGLLVGESKYDTETMLQTFQSQRERFTSKNTPYLLTWAQQIRMCIARRTQVQLGDMATPFAMSAAMLLQGLIVGSGFYNMPKTTAGFFPRGGVMFFQLLFTSFMAQTEITVAYAQRPIVIRHRKFALVHPSADALANTLLDLPVRTLNVTVFAMVVYFLTGLARTADQFFINWSVILLVTVVMVAVFRTLAATFRNAAAATLLGGLCIIWFALYAGYSVPRASMTKWWKWLSYCNPVAFAFEILMTNEFRRLDVPCAGLVPSYPDVPLEHKACTTPGGSPGSSTVNGLAYLSIEYGYSWDNRQRNIGILIAFLVTFILLYAIMTEFQMDPSGSGGVAVFRRGTDSSNAQEQQVQPAQQATGKTAAEQGADWVTIDAGMPPSNDDIFAWKDVVYTVDIKGEQRRLLDEVTAYVQPGKMTALMGESGAGKTTLLNVLAGRTDSGVISGDFSVNGWPLPASFQQQTGYCQQQDTHLSTATVREALQFSALLRQSSGTRQQKLDYAEEVIRMLDMEPFAEALVGNEGEGLSVEQRKRLTIGVELAAKPKLLLFLDEPTSGMDSLAAWSIMRFLKKLANSGQSILCTIHQPSGELFAQFDRLLLLKRGGKTVFSGNLHNEHRVCGRMLDYFESRSGQLNGHGNPAEFMLECIGAGATSTASQDWVQLYKESHLAVEMREEVDKIMARRHQPQFQPTEESSVSSGEFAASFMTQLTELIKRTATHYWRNPGYVVAKMGLELVAGLFIGSSFWGQGTKPTVKSLQNKLFATLLGVAVCLSLSQQMLPEFLVLRDLFQIREQPSKMYSWVTMLLAFMAIELPINWLGGTLFWIPWASMASLPSKAFSWFFYSILFQSFWSLLALAIQNMGAPNAMISGVVFALLFCIILLFSGTVQPTPLFPTFYKKWLVHVSPLTYYIEAVLGGIMAGHRIECGMDELAPIRPPDNMTCDQYLHGFSSEFDDPSPVGMGYYTTNPDGSCGFCQYRYASEFLTNDSLDANHRFRDIGIMSAYIAINFFMIFFFYWFFYVFSMADLKAKRKARKNAQQGPGAERDLYAARLEDEEIKHKF